MAMSGMAASGATASQTLQSDAYQPSGLTAADLQWSSPEEKGKVWKVIGATVGALVLIAGAAVGGWFVRDAQGDDAPAPEPSPKVADVAAMQKSLTEAGFECANAFTDPLQVDLCFREDADYQELVGFQMIDKERVGWLKLRVEAARPAKQPARQRAEERFPSILDQALVEKDATAAKKWLEQNLTDDYDKREYLTYEAGTARLQLLPRKKQSVLLWIRLTAASYHSLGEEALPEATAEATEKHLTDEGFSCSPAEGGVSCEKKEDAGDMAVGFGVSNGTVSVIRIVATPGGQLEALSDPTRDLTAGLIGLSLTGKDLEAATKWLEGAFDGQAHRTVLSGIDLRVAPVQRAGGKTVYEVDIRPVDW